MNHTDFERKKPVNIRTKNPFIVRCNVILLKHALTKAEVELQTRIVTGFNLVNIEPAVKYIREAKNAVIIALQENCFSDEILFPIADILHNAYKNAPLPEILAIWERALDFIADMPIPYRIVEAESLSPIGTIVPKKHDDYEPIVTWSDATLEHYHAKYKNDTYREFKVEALWLEREYRDFEAGQAGELLIGAAIEMSAIAVGDTHRQNAIVNLKQYLTHRGIQINMQAVEHLQNFNNDACNLYFERGAK